MRRLFSFLLVLLSGLLAACSSSGRLPQSPLTAALERKVGRIAYVGADGNVYTIDQAGGHQQMLTQDAHPPEEGVTRFYQLPTWSSSDNRLAFIEREIYADGRLESTVFATQSDAEDPLAIFSSTDDQPLLYLSWSPTAQWVSFLTANQDSNALQMRLAPADGGEAAVVESGQPLFWDWSPEGLELTSHAGGAAAVNPQGARLSRVRLGAEVQQFGLGIAPSSFQAPAYSPDGQHLLLAGDGGGGQQQLMLTDSAGRLENTLMDFDGSIAFAWSPKQDIAAVLNGDLVQGMTIGQLSLIDLRHPSAPETITIDSDKAIGFFWAPNGKKLAYFELLTISQPPAGDPSGGSEQIVVLELKVAQVNNGKTKQVWLFRATSQFLDYLVYFDQYQRATTIWSPDSNYLVVPAYTSADRQQLAIVPASGNFEPRYLVDAQLAFWSWE